MTNQPVDEKQKYELEIASTRVKRMKWWSDARFGMFIHWGLYSQLGRHEWVMNRERIPIAEYEKLADTWKPKPRPMREWTALAKKAGMKYMVMTTKHHEGFCLWDTKLTDYNAVQRGPKRDLVREYVQSCREAGLKVGFYYSLMDWHHPDGAACAKDEAARRRFIDYTYGLVEELMSNYGKIDILWYDVAWPLQGHEKWEGLRINKMVRGLQPHIIINPRLWLNEDFGTPEEHIRAEDVGRSWEACMTFNGSWGYMPSAIDWRPVREVIEMLRQVAAGQGNLLLNVGPKPDGSLPKEAAERLIPVGKWLAKNGEAVYGKVDRVTNCEWMPTGQCTQKGNTRYFWCRNWPGGELVLGGYETKLRKASFLVTGKPIKFEQTENRIVLKGLPKANPDKFAGTCVIKLQFAAPPVQRLGTGCVLI